PLPRQVSSAGISRYDWQPAGLTGFLRTAIMRVDHRRLSAFICGFASLLACAVPARAQTDAGWPSRPLRLIVPFAPGGTTDTIARLVARELTKSLGQSVVVENRPGAGGLIGAEAALKLPADGYTIFFATISTMAVQPALQPKLAYDPLKDFAPVTLIATLPYILAAHPSLPAHSLPQLVKLARAKPASISYGTPGYGTGAHLSA